MIIQQYLSPNYNDRPMGIVPDIVVLHYTGMQSASVALERLRDPVAEVSAHYMIDETGNVLELVHPSKRAWHAGISSWAGRENLNHYSIGIELVNPGHEFGYTDFPSTQLASLLDLLKQLNRDFDIKRHMYVGHSDIAPDRKEDPGEKFPWQMLAHKGFGIYCNKDGSGQEAILSDQMNNDAILRQKIIQLQNNLQLVGYRIEKNGLYDQQTKACVMAFQRHWRQNYVTGVYDAGTDIVLNDIMYQNTIMSN
jgi:N-acetylmuramoyl-L-alanine amidase